MQGIKVCIKCVRCLRQSFNGGGVILLIPISILLYCGHCLFAQSLPLSFEKSQEPITVKAKELVYNSAKRVAIYKGDVVVKRGKSLLFADVMSIYLSKNSKIMKIIADGNVKIVDGEKTARSHHAEYYEKERMVLLTGDPVIQERDNVLKGERIKFFLDTNEIKAEGNVETIYLPKPKKNSKSVKEDRNKE